MKKQLTTSLFCCLCLFTLGSLVFTGCAGGDDLTPIADKGGSTDSGAATVIDPKTVADSLGGDGFDAWAEKNGWLTNNDLPIYGDAAAKKGGSLTYAFQEFPTALRPIGKDSRFQVVSVISGLVYETLLGLDAKTLKMTPALATHWKMSDDKLTYTFRLDPRARFSDGSSVTADDVIASYNIHADTTIEDPATNQRFSEGFERPTKISPLMVSVKVKKESWRNLMDFGGGLYIFPARYLNKLGGGKDFLARYKNDMIAGSGPYVLDKSKTEEGKFLALKRRTDWWQKDIAANVGMYNFDELRFPIVLNEDLILEKIKKGELDVYYANRSSWWKDHFEPSKNENVKRGLLQRRKIYNFDPKGTSGLAFNTRKAPFNDIKVRQAFAHFWNIDLLNKEIFLMEYERVVSYFQGSNYANPSNKLVPYNPAKGIALLNEAGWKKAANEPYFKKDGKIFEIDLNLFDKSQERVYIPLQDELKKIGIKLNLVQVTPQAGFQKVMNHDFIIHPQNWTGTPFPMPEDNFSSKRADQKESGNITGLKNAEIDALCDAYEKEYDPAKRIRMAQKMDSIAVLQQQYAFGWVAPFTFRGVYWNKLGMPKTGFDYAGNHLTNIFAYWWYDADKDAQLQAAKADKSKTMPVGPLEIDAFGRKAKK